MIDAAQQVTAARASTAGDPAGPVHPLARHSYEFRGQAAQNDKQARALAKKIWRAETAQNALIRELEEHDDSPAAAMRARIRARFAELEQDRATASEQLTSLDTASDQAGDPALLDALPVMTARLDELPPRHRAAIYQALDLELLYSKDMHQVTIYATITDRTPQALASLINDSEPPAHATTPASSDVAYAPIACKIRTAERTRR